MEIKKPEKRIVTHSAYMCGHREEAVVYNEGLKDGLSYHKAVINKICEEIDRIIKVKGDLIYLIALKEYIRDISQVKEEK